jgi:hypothetical protein
MARILAGISGAKEGEAAPAPPCGAFESHAISMGMKWDRCDKTSTSKIAEWSRLNLPRTENARTLFYPFSGADFLFAHAFFPDQRSYVLVGMERVGTLPEVGGLSCQGLEKPLFHVRETLSPLLTTGFFRTGEMQADMGEGGVVTVLLALLAGTGHRIFDVQAARLHGDGSFGDPGGDGGVPCSRILFAGDGESEVRDLTYIRADLSDGGLAREPGVLALLDAVPPHATFLKAASYLLHSGSFAVLRDRVLARSSLILEDDTGVPLRFFEPGRWDLRLFGNYTRPIRMFSSFRQKDLAEAYRSAEGIGPVEFHVGYGEGQIPCNLLLAKRKGEPAGAGSPGPGIARGISN